jgi:hypothetical protein
MKVNIIIIIILYLHQESLQYYTNITLFMKANIWDVLDTDLAGYPASPKSGYPIKPDTGNSVGFAAKSLIGF